VQEAYVAAIACFDAKIFLVPGSDGTCRAAREAMAMGKPIIAARRGMLPEIVDHGVNGLVIDDTPENIAQAILQLAGDRDRTRQMGRQALEKAHQVYNLDKQTAAVMEIYRKLLGEHGHPQSGAD
jgi:glycosyltransferase involved in cell wall biosynthesis